METGHISVPLKRQPCGPNIPGFPDAYLCPLHTRRWLPEAEWSEMERKNIGSPRRRNSSPQYHRAKRETTWAGAGVHKICSIKVPNLRFLDASSTALRFSLFFFCQSDKLSQREINLSKLLSKQGMYRSEIGECWTELLGLDSC